MKNVLVLMHDDAGQEARFQCALDLVRAVEGHLACLDVSILPVMAGDQMMFADTALLIANEQADEQANRTRMEARLRAEEVPYDWTDANGDLAGALRDAAPLADLIVVNRQLDSVAYPDMLGVAGELIVKSGKPVLAVPEDARRFDPFGAVLVAWDGSRAADAALRAAVPLLQMAERVTLIEVDDGTIVTPGNEAAEYLSRHGVRAEVRALTNPDGPVGDILLAEVRRDRPGYLVMGGYGHNRVIEALFGGVTRQMLRHSPVPLLLAH